MAKRVRLDVLLVERGLAESRERAQRLIRAGLVYTDHERLDKPGRPVDAEISLFVKGDDCPYVSRGGLKLAGALDHFGVDPAGRIVVDLGASTGGFTDCLLQRGAILVHAIDVGRGQLHERLLRDERVMSRERTHIDALEPGMLNPSPTLAVADLSFISLRRAFPVLKRVLPAGGKGILLLKPQFEVGRAGLSRGGILRDDTLREKVLHEVVEAAKADGIQVLGTCDSPITGADGNHEYFLHVQIV
ncbi:MAG: TlyA family RNA methyltransferase [Candidatus Sumerlaeia bacterium]|nr:TlyA family RNA methyltransferase [Candidatus Sumerlaeia bacterium]